MSPTSMPSFFRSFSVTNEGPVSMIEGSDPIEAIPLTRARGFRPSASPISLEPNSTPAAPSTMPELLPAWCTWFIRSTCG